MDFSFLTGCARQFWQITSGVCREVAACVGGGVRPATLPQDLVVAVYRRVNGLQNRFLALMERVRAGRQRGGWTRVPPDVVGPRLPRASMRAGVALPRRFGWLVHLVGHEAAGRGSQLAHLLSDPAMAVLVRDVPQARRILAPLCRMLGVALGVALDGPRVVRRRVRAAAAKATEGLAPERIGYVPSAKWPRGVITRGVVRFRPG